MAASKAIDRAIKVLDDGPVIYVKRRNKYYVDVHLSKRDPYISSLISNTLRKAKRVESLLGSPTSWDVLVEGDDNERYVKNLLSGIADIK